jgi:hypothetical protein
MSKQEEVIACCMLRWSLQTADCRQSVVCLQSARTAATCNLQPCVTTCLCHTEELTAAPSLRAIYPSYCWFVCSVCLVSCSVCVTGEDSSNAALSTLSNWSSRVTLQLVEQLTRVTTRSLALITHSLTRESRVE